MVRCLCLLLLAAAVGCGSPTRLLVDTRGAPDWVAEAIQRAADFWAGHGLVVDAADLGGEGVGVEVDQASRDWGDFGYRLPDLRPELRLSTSLEQFEADEPLRVADIAAHEIGHAIGMGHVSDPRSLMAHPVAAPDDGTCCFWSAADAHEFAAVTGP